MITIPIAVINDWFKWQLSLFWFCHKRTYGSTAYKKAHALIVQRNFPSEEAKFDINHWKLSIPHTITKPFFEFKEAWKNANVPLNIQTSLLQVIDKFNDNQLIELTDCDVCHFRSHPDIKPGDSELYVDAIYENWHLKSLSDNRSIIEPYFLNNGAYYNGGFVPIIAKVKVLKKILKDWIDIHVDITRRYPEGNESWWAGMYALQAACERNKIIMVHKDYCYISHSNNPIKEQSYIAHYCCDHSFDKKILHIQYNEIDYLPDNPFYNLVKDWKQSHMFPFKNHE